MPHGQHTPRGSPAGLPAPRGICPAACVRSTSRGDCQGDKRSQFCLPGSVVLFLRLKESGQDWALGRQPPPRSVLPPRLLLRVRPSSRGPTSRGLGLHPWCRAAPLDGMGPVHLGSPPAGAPSCSSFPDPSLACLRPPQSVISPTSPAVLSHPFAVFPSFWTGSSDLVSSSLIFLPIISDVLLNAFRF